MSEALTDFLSAVVNGVVTAGMVLLIVAFVACAVGPFFFGRNDR